MSSGPDFAVLLRRTAVSGRAAGLRCATGMGVGIAIWVLAVGAGVAALLTASTVVLVSADRGAGRGHSGGVVRGGGPRRCGGAPVPRLATDPAHPRHHDGRRPHRGRRPDRHDLMADQPILGLDEGCEVMSSSSRSSAAIGGASCAVLHSHDLPVRRRSDNIVGRASFAEPVSLVAAPTGRRGSLCAHCEPRMTVREEPRASSKCSKLQPRG